MTKTKAEIIVEQRPRRDPGLIRRGEMAFADWVKAGMISLPPPAQVVEEEGLTLRNYGKRWRFLNQREINH